jgi:hypothetical protein
MDRDARRMRVDGPTASAQVRGKGVDEIAAHLERPPPRLDPGFSFSS